MILRNTTILPAFFQLLGLSLTTLCVLVVGLSWIVSTQYLQPTSGNYEEVSTNSISPNDIGLSFRDILIETEDQLKISAWYIPGKRKHPGIVLVPALAGTKHMVLNYVPSLHESGFNLLLIDLRNSGDSDGTFNSLGFHEQKDINAGVNYLMERKKLPMVGILGISTGAGAALMAMESNEQISVGVFESAFMDFESVVRGDLQQQFGPFAEPIYPLVEELFSYRSQSDPRKISPISAIAKISPRAVFVIHGKEDETFAFEHGTRLFSTANQPKKFWPVNQGNHATAWSQDKIRAEQEIPRFFQKQFTLRKASL